MRSWELKDYSTYVNVNVVLEGSKQYRFFCTKSRMDRSLYNDDDSNTIDYNIYFVPVSYSSNEFFNI